MSDAVVPEFSKPLNVQTLGEKPKMLHLIADDAARKSLSERFDLLSIDSLFADFTISRIGNGDLIGVRGRVTADVTQSCVVSDVPVAAKIDEIVDERFGPPEETDLEIDISMEEIDPPEPIVDDVIDLGELVAQYLGVALNPYPKAPDAVIPDRYQSDIDDDIETTKNPFEALASLKKRTN